jgi:hypothetical protein
MSYGWLPTQLLLSQKFDSIGKIGHVRMPVLFVHGAEDRYVPPRLSEVLYAAAPQPKKLLLIPNGTHNNSAWMGDADYRPLRCGSCSGRSRSARSCGNRPHFAPTERRRASTVDRAKRSRCVAPRQRIWPRIDGGPASRRWRGDLRSDAVFLEGPELARHVKSNRISAVRGLP